MTYNLSSPKGILEPCDLANLESWFVNELELVDSPSQREVLSVVSSNLEAFIQSPKAAVLLWPGCDRVPEVGKRQKYFAYPRHIKALAVETAFTLDTRANGPAVAAFLIAGGTRPDRFGSANAWSVHHLYSGKYPYIGRTETLHAAKTGDHFTQSAGLIAAHPIADAMVDEFPFFAWLLRARSFKVFGYDPDGVFAARHGALGFADGWACKVIDAAT
jgi:hypothetical protein